MEDGFIKNMLIGIRKWVYEKILNINTSIGGINQDLEDMSYVISSNFNNLNDRVTIIENSSIIDDTDVTSATTFSSSKIVDLLDEKLDIPDISEEDVLEVLEGNDE